MNLKRGRVINSFYLMPALEGFACSTLFAGREQQTPLAAATVTSVHEERPGEVR